MGCGHHRRVGALRRTRRFRLRAGRRVSRRDRRACALAAGGGRRPVRSVARRSIPTRALSACADSRWITRTRWLGRRCFRGRRAPGIRFRGPGRDRIHSHQAHAAGSAAVARANSRRAHRFERCNLDDRKLGDSPRTIARRRTRLCCGRRTRLRRRRRRASSGRSVPLEGQSRRRHRPGCGRRRRGWRTTGPCGRVSNDCAQPKTPSGRGPDRHADLRPRLPQCPDRRRRIPGLRCRCRSGRLHDSRHRSRWPDRSGRSDDAWRATTCCRLRPRARVLGSADRTHLPLVQSRAGDLPACGCRCCQQRRGCRRLHPAPANRPG